MNKSVPISTAVPAHIERLREIEQDAGNRFRSIGLDVTADGEPPARAF